MIIDDNELIMLLLPIAAELFPLTELFRPKADATVPATVLACPVHV